MKNDDINEPAFPVAGALGANQFNGMTLRDYFATAAMQAAATNQDGADGFTFNQRAEWAYMQADAMLRERSK